MSLTKPTDAMEASLQERLLGALGAAIVVSLLGYALLVGMTVAIQVRAEQPMTIVDLQAPLSQPHRPRPRVYRPKPGKANGRASPHNLRSKAAAIVAPPLVLPLPTPLVAAPKAGIGAAASAGASDRPGPGEGAGGQGNGSGSGNDGNGDGDGGGDVPPRYIKGRLKISDLPPALRDAGVGGAVSVRYEVEVSGRVSNCVIMASSGNAELDKLTCQLIEQRFRFDPSRDSDGQPVSSRIEETHHWIIDKIPDAPPRG